MDSRLRGKDERMKRPCSLPQAFIDMLKVIADRVLGVAPHTPIAKTDTIADPQIIAYVESQDRGRRPELQGICKATWMTPVLGETGVPARE